MYTRLTARGFAQLRVLPLRQFDRVRSAKLPRNGAQNYRPRFTCKSREHGENSLRILSHRFFYLFQRVRGPPSKCYSVRMERRDILFAVVERDLFSQSRDLTLNTPRVRAFVRSYHGGDLRRKGFRSMRTYNGCRGNFR